MSSKAVPIQPAITTRLRIVSPRESYINNVMQKLREINSWVDLARETQAFINSGFLLPAGCLFCDLFAYKDPEKMDKLYYVSGLANQDAKATIEIIGDGKTKAKLWSLAKQALKNPLIYYPGEEAFLSYNPSSEKPLPAKVNPFEVIFLREIGLEQLKSETGIKTLAFFPIIDSAQVPDKLKRTRGLFCFALASVETKEKKIIALMSEFSKFCELLAVVLRRMKENNQLNPPY